MKVLFATYPMAFHTPGGGELQLLAYKKHLPFYGVDVHLYDMWKSNLRDFDLVHFFSCVAGSVHFCNFVKSLGIPLVVSSSLWITEETLNLYPSAEIHAQLALADLVVTNSNMESDALSAIFSLPREKFVTILNGADEKFFVAASPDIFRSYFGIKDNFVLNVGNIEPRKNQLLLIRAMKSIPDMKLVLIGHVRDEAYFDLCMKEGLGQVHYLGPLQQSTQIELIKSAYSACTVFCLPSTLETPGLAALEAYITGAPVVITEVGSTREYFGGNVAYIDPFDERTIVKAITNLRNAPPKQVMQKNEFDWHSVVKPLSACYASLIK